MIRLELSAIFPKSVGNINTPVKPKTADTGGWKSLIFQGSGSRRGFCRGIADSCGAN